MIAVGFSPKFNSDINGELKVSAKTVLEYGFLLDFDVELLYLTMLCYIFKV